MPTTQDEISELNLGWVRAQFPALNQTVNGCPAVFLDGPGGTQVSQRVIDAITGYLETCNANTHGAFATSERTDAVIGAARSAMADLFGCDPDEVVFGPNMTSLTYAISRALGREIDPGEEILVTQLDHDANVSPWRALEERGAVIRFVDINERDCTLDMNDLAHKVTNRTKLIAVGYASNAVGTINPVQEIVRLAHQAGALAFIDAVHYAPHGPIDVRDLDCDFLVCSSYKFFGPHMGVLYGRRKHLQELRPYKLRVSTEEVPQRWEWGTLNHECIAGITACVDYLANLGRQVKPAAAGRRDALGAAYQAIQKHERGLIGPLIRGLLEIPGLQFYGITDPIRFGHRCPTVAVRIAGHAPRELATELGQRGFFTWDGNYYALNLSERLDVEKHGGFLRIGLAHYNTAEEVEKLLAALRGIAR
jgi:cysteine desulfurase family protein (TIGR01976 family)